LKLTVGKWLVVEVLGSGKWGWLNAVGRWLREREGAKNEEIKQGIKACVSKIVSSETNTELE